jgi:hypothetical protein
MRIKILVILYLLSSVLIFSQENNNITWDVGNIGWEMQFSQNGNSGEMTFKFFNLYVENTKTNIGLIINPLNVNINHVSDVTNMQINFLNLDLYWNIFGKDTVIFGPFISINYFNMRQWNSMNFADITLNMGLKFLWRKFFFDSGKIMESYTFRIIGTELGFRYNYFDGHKFYFNINFDLLTLLYFIGMGKGMGEVIEANNDYERGRVRP